ncbi:MAG: YkgJ family cysteine cluster protein [Polyangiaceae bacterium]|nr:YkgJ family cysteine cluster protein [Polyangiaceae bacterium]
MSHFETVDGLGIQCRRCGDCCRGARVPLTDRDLWRLVAATGLDPAALVDWLAPNEIDMTGEPETFVRLREGRRLMVLRHEREGCPFLVEDVCSVHPHRPLACATFPYDLDLGLGGEPVVIGLAGASCVPRGPPDVMRVADCLNRMRAELADYARRVTEWNRRQRRRLRLARLPEDTDRLFAFLARARSLSAIPRPAGAAVDFAGSIASDRR